MTVHSVQNDVRSAGERIADYVSEFVGSWTFVTIHILWWGVWMVLPVESYPFGLLTMIVSLEAIMLSTFIMMSQNRAAIRDRRRAETDLRTDKAAKVEIEVLAKRLDAIEIEKLDKIVRLLESK